MKKPEGYDQALIFDGEIKSITPGGHICQIKGAKTELTHNGDEMLVIMFDICEGENKGFYADQFKSRTPTNSNAKWPGVFRQGVTGKGISFLKGMITAIEESNSGYKWNWEEKTLTNKLFGGVFGQEEWENQDGDTKLSTKLVFIRSVEAVKKGVKVPEIKRLKGSISNGIAESFGKEIDDSEIPF